MNNLGADMLSVNVLWFVIIIGIWILNLLFMMWIGSLVIKNGIQKSGIIEAIDSLTNVIESK
ncbi:hypothetical protein [Pseudolactococcus laudensis]|uniref:Uncharacterized protein n=1 Tax=Pseudolactococcus laudensis TaxID=1494461 RepID=A0A7V8N123_9LACT|nr:hypothetical protein [Lactococcus laudensis]MBQ6145238.1 hypothetical protein [Lactococcus sp.]CCK20842.1 hypothetical protein BN193_11530 [Lactococcus raffinolactis 4877]MBA0016744.1 hypothetical protein [Lactococcus laudensis]MBR2763517.1 hypothetical protein [Lactococcus sp.]MBW9281447.1 hypothetical protein [Lactococcus laudensis]